MLVLLATGGPLLPAFKEMPVLAVRVKVGDKLIWNLLKKSSPKSKLNTTLLLFRLLASLLFRLLYILIENPA